jgi:hypothetical protein
VEIRVSKQIGWLCYTAEGAQHFIWKADDAEEQAWLDKRYPRREPVYTGHVLPEAASGRDAETTSLDAGKSRSSGDLERPK